MPSGDLNQQRAAVRLNLEGPVFARIEDWRRSQLKIPSRSRAVLDLVERALNADRKLQNTTAARPLHGEAEREATSSRAVGAE
jgi:hypothetical protein